MRCLISSSTDDGTVIEQAKYGMPADSRKLNCRNEISTLCLWRPHTRDKSWIV